METTTLRVLVGVVVVVLRDGGQDGEALEAGLLELDGAGANGVVELVGAALGVALEVAGEQVGADPQQELDLVDQLGQEVTCARREAVVAALGAGSEVTTRTGRLSAPWMRRAIEPSTSRPVIPGGRARGRGARRRTPRERCEGRGCW